MAVTEVQNRPNIMLGAQIKEGAGQGSGALQISSPEEQVTTFLPEDEVLLTQNPEISILTGPTPSHNIVQIRRHTGEVIEIPPNSKSALYALAQRLAKYVTN